VALTGTITAITADPVTLRFQVAVRYSNGTYNQDDTITVDPGSTVASVQQQIKNNGLQYVNKFAQRAAFDAGVSSYQQYVGAVVAVA